MNTGSAFARVIGITKSLSPLSFDRNRDRESDPVPDIEADAADQMVAALTEDAPALLAEANVAAKADDDDATPATTAVAEAAQADDDKPFQLIGPVAPAASEAGVVVQFPALAQVTVVADAAPSQKPADPTRPDRIREEVAGDMIDAIETDIASLLASMEPGADDDGDEAVAKAGDAGPADSSEDADREEPTLSLLSELNRMWRADPKIAASRF